MEKLTYRQAYDKIIEAYFEDKISPCNINFCFCGTLNNGSGWAYAFGGHYTPAQYGRMEQALFSKIEDAHYVKISLVWSISKGKISPSYTEDELFDGMCAALEVLKSIHKSRGENVDEIPAPFTQRKLKQLL